MTLVRIAKDWDWPDLLRQTPGGKGIWDGVRFTTDEVEECDALVVLNTHLKRSLRARCPRRRVWALMQEPYVRGVTDWMAEGHEAFDRVCTNYQPSSAPKYVVSQPALPWHVNRTFDELVACHATGKTRPLSWVVGNANYLPGHVKRLAFLRALQAERGLDVDLFGRAVRPIADKWDGLAAYRYSIAAENTVWPDYWTEKIADCFLAWTVPLYHGCGNLEKYFPADSFIRLNVENPREAIETIQSVLREDDWQRRLPALAEARRRVLYEHQIFPHLAKMLRDDAGPLRERDAVVIPPYRKSLGARLAALAVKIRRVGGAL
jgi:hypothetical protein